MENFSNHPSNAAEITASTSTIAFNFATQNKTFDNHLQPFMYIVLESLNFAKQQKGNGIK